MKYMDKEIIRKIRTDIEKKIKDLKAENVRINSNSEYSNEKRDSFIKKEEKQREELKILKLSQEKLTYGDLIIEDINKCVRNIDDIMKERNNEEKNIRSNTFLLTKNLSNIEKMEITLRELN